MMPRAFPRQQHGSRDQDSQTGMTLRQWYVGQAIVGLRAGDTFGDVDSDTVVMIAFKDADAAIAFEEKK